MKRLIIFLLLFAAIKVAGQTTGYLRFDTVKITKQNGTCELYIINKTKDSLGQLTNVSGGLTRFIKPKKLNDSTLVIGLDTISLAGNSQLFVLRISSTDQEIVRFNGTNGDIQGTPGVTANGSGNFAVPSFWTLTNAGGIQYAMLPLSHAYSTPTTSSTNTPFDHVTGAQTQSSGNLEMFRIATNYNQTGTAGATDFIIRRTETAIGSGQHDFLRFDGGAAGTTERFSVDRLGRVKVGQLDNGTASDSVVVWDAATRYLKKVLQSDIGSKWEYNGSNNLVPKTFAGNQVQINNKSFLITGATGSIPTTATGTHFFWYPAKQAFRAGQSFSTEWSDANIGQYSFAFGEVAEASSFGSIAIGSGVHATGTSAIAIGNGATASATGATAIGGSGNVASGQDAFATGEGSRARARTSFVAGTNSETNVSLIIPQFSIGKLNDTTKAGELFRIGWVTGSGRNNIFSVDTLGRTKIGKLDTGGSSDSIVVWDATDSLLKKVAQSSISGGGGGGTGFGIDSTVISGTTGSVLFVGTGPVLAQDNANFFWDNSNKRLGIGTASPDRLLHVEASDAITNAITFARRMTHITSGTATTSFGVGEEIELENASGTNIIAGTVTFSWSDATNASEDAAWTLNLVRGGSMAQAATISSLGALTIANSLVASGNATIGSANSYFFSGRSSMNSSTNGDINLFNNAQNGFGRLNFGGTSSSFPSLLRSSANLIVRLADNSANTDLEVLDEAYDATTWNGSNEVPTKNATRDKIEGMNIVQGTYTPTLTNGANVDASTVPGTTLYYSRLGNQVTVWGMVTIDPNAAAASTVLSISLPIASALTSYTQLSGQATGNIVAGAYFGGFIQGDDTNDRAQLDFTSGTTLNQTWSIRFTYEIL